MLLKPDIEESIRFNLMTATSIICSVLDVTLQFIVPSVSIEGSFYFCSREPETIDQLYCHAYNHLYFKSIFQEVSIHLKTRSFKHGRFRSHI